MRPADCDNARGLNSSAGLPLPPEAAISPASVWCWLIAVLKSSLITQQPLACWINSLSLGFLSPTWGWATFWGDAVTTDLSEPRGTRETRCFLNFNTQDVSFVARKELKNVLKEDTFAPCPSITGSCLLCLFRVYSVPIEQHQKGV